MIIICNSCNFAICDLINCYWRIYKNTIRFFLVEFATLCQCMRLPFHSIRRTMASRPPFSARSPALHLEIVAKCPTTKARVSRLHLPHFVADLPMFMPVGTQGAMKGLTTQQLEDLDCHVILGNTYHLVSRI